MSKSSFKRREIVIFKTKNEVASFRKYLENATKDSFEKFRKARIVSNVLSRSIVLD